MSLAARAIRTTAPVAAALLAGPLAAGPYSGPRGDASKADAGIPGFVGSAGDGESGLQTGSTGNRVNPIFFGWAESWTAYHQTLDTSGFWDDPTYGMGPVTGDVWDVVSLGDLDEAALLAGAEPGSITLTLSRPLRDLPGADLAVFENGFSFGASANLAADLAYVEVSSDGETFVRFPARSLTPSVVSQYGTLNPTNVFNLAGKHANSYGTRADGTAYGESWGTPFDLSQLAGDPLVMDGTVNLDAITHVRLIDIPGTGFFTDSTGAPIYDPWLTVGSGGFDLEALGTISVPVDFAAWAELKALPGGVDGPGADPDGDGASNLIEAAIGREPLRRDATPPLVLTTDNGQATLEFTRDTRLTGVTIEVETSTGLDQWQVMARSVAGGPLVKVLPFDPSITEESASSIASLGVIRRQRLQSVLSSSEPRFFRLRVHSSVP